MWGSAMKPAFSIYWEPESPARGDIAYVANEDWIGYIVYDGSKWRRVLSGPTISPAVLLLRSLYRRLDAWSLYGDWKAEL